MYAIRIRSNIHHQSFQYVSPHNILLHYNMYYKVSFFRRLTLLSSYKCCSPPPPSLIRPLHHISAYFSLVKRIPSHSSRAQISPVSLIQPRPDELSRPMSASLSSAEVLSALRKVMYTQSSIPSAFSKSAQSRAAHRDSLYFSAHHFNSPSASRADFISTKLIIIQPTSV